MITRLLLKLLLSDAVRGWTEAQIIIQKKSEGCNKCCSYNKADDQGQNCWEINGRAIAAQLNSYRVTRKSTSLTQGLLPRHVDPATGAGNWWPGGAVWPRRAPQDKPLFFQIIAPGCLFFFFSKSRLPLLCRARNNGFKPQQFADPITLFLHPKPIDILHNPKLHPLGKIYASTIYITNNQSLSSSISKLRLDYQSVVCVCRTQKNKKQT